MKFVRWLLGRIILLLDFIFTPSSKKRSPEQQNMLDVQTAQFKLYQFKACPFCVKVRRHMRRRSIKIDLKDAKTDLLIKEELIREGGKHKVPCLRIAQGNKEVQWLYSSDEICRFLDAKLDQLKVV